MNEPVNQAEKIGIQQISEAFGHVFPSCRIMSNVILPMDLEGSPIETAEYDCIVACRAGVFVFEIKGYKDTHITFHTSEEGKKQWRLNSHNGSNFDVADPLNSGIAKRVYLNKSLAASGLICVVRSYVLLPIRGVSIDPAMPSSVVLPGDLSFVARLLRSDAKRRSKYMDDSTVDAIAEGIVELSSNHTMKEHIANCQRYKERYKATPV